MSIVSEVKCPRCDRRYSGIRGRCPYCGARRTGRGKHSSGGENTKGKIIIGLLLMGVLIVAVVVLLMSSLKDKPDPAETESPVSTPPTGQEVETMPGIGTEPPETTPPDDDTPSPPEQPSPVVEKVTITYAGKPIAAGEFTCDIGEPVPLKVKIEPEGIEARIEWTSDKEDVFTVSAETGLVTGISQGWGTVTVTVGDVSDSCTVRVSNKRYGG